MSVERIASLWTKFHDLDEVDTYATALREAESNKALNFVVEFNFHKARIAFNLDPDDFDVLVTQEPLEGFVRWINVWSPDTQRSAVECIGSHYGFSRRLQALMTTQSSATRIKPARTHAVPAPERKDVELGSVSTEAKVPPSTQTAAQASEDIEIYRLVKETMNYTSIDHGKQFLCIGANWLHRRPEMEIAGAKKSLLPPRHWSWLALCSKSVVLSLHETPPPEQRGNNEWAEKELRSMRSNTIAVLLQLSKHGVDKYRNSVITLKFVRQAMAKTPQANDAQEGSSNLFFYLFEDYSGAVPVLKESGAEIHDLSERILTSTSRRSKLKTGDVIRPLHELRRELRQLQHLFESYKSLIRRICWPRSVDAHQEGSFGVLEPSGNVSGDVKISPSARSRFERLGDRLQLLMLNTIQEYLDELNALSGTYFNLVAQKDSQATARLSRSATVLAKLSVFFLPITFMTSYFSVEIPHLVEYYTPKMYWICFAVIAGLSFISLFFFSRMLEFLSDELEGWADSGSRKLRKMCGLHVYEERDDH